MSAPYEPTDHSLIIRTLETVASLNTKLDIMMAQLAKFESWREIQEKRYAEHTRALDQHAHDIEDYGNRLEALEVRPEKARDRWHQYAIATFCGVFSAIALAIAKSKLGVP